MMPETGAAVARARRAAVGEGSRPALYRQAVQSLFDLLESTCEGAVAVDREARISWINDRYAALLGLNAPGEAIGRPVEEVIPNSLMRWVVESGRPMLLDIMQFRERYLVVIRIPLRDHREQVIGALGFVLYDNLKPLAPLIAKFSRLQADLNHARRELAERRQAKYTLADYIGDCRPSLELKRQARRVARLDTTVLLQGETGTGKELLAHAIHAESPRAGRPFVGINVAAVPENLLEAEFFGVAPGAYTGADRRGREGKFQLAHGGTLFLDEVGDMPLHLQVKLLRVLQEQELEPLGSNRMIPVDIRIIAATSRNLEAMVEAGTFRADLYFRLNVLPLRLPALRERREDLPALAAALLARISDRAAEPLRTLAPEALEVLAAYDWPGNVRELRNALERVTLVSDRLRLEAEDIRGILPTAAVTRATRTAADAAGEYRRASVRPLAEVIADAERTALVEALHACAGRKTEAARRLGISRASLYEKLHQHRLI